MDLKYIIYKLGIQDKITEEAMLDMLKDEGIITLNGDVNIEYQDSFSVDTYKRIEINKKGVAIIIHNLRKKGISIRNKNFHNIDQIRIQDYFAGMDLEIEYKMKQIEKLLSLQKN